MLDGPLSQALYEWELEEHLAFWRKGMLRDKNTYLIVVTEHSGDVAMLVIDKKGKVLVNAEARSWLRREYKTPDTYARNMAMVIPHMARQLHGGDIWVTGVRNVSDAFLGAAKRPKWLD